MCHLLAGGDAMKMNEVGTLPMVEFYAAMDKFIAHMKQQAKAAEKNAKYG